MRIAENIARMRRAQGLTQEALAERIGVSGQTVSKWETAATWPDVALLPVIADVFGVTVDALYGRDAAYPDVSAQTAWDAVVEAVREIIVATIHVPELDGDFAEHLDKYRRAMAQEKRQRSVIENDRDVLYYRDAVGALALRKPEEGWSSLFGREENLAVLRLAADEDFRRAMQVILSRRMLNFTIPTLARAAGVEDAVRLENLVQTSGLFARRELLIDEAPLVFYELTTGEMKLYLLYAVLVFAQELGTYESIHYCFMGNGRYFTP